MMGAEWVPLSEAVAAARKPHDASQTAAILRVWQWLYSERLEARAQGAKEYSAADEPLRTEKNSALPRSFWGAPMREALSPVEDPDVFALMDALWNENTLTVGRPDGSEAIYFGIQVRRLQLLDLTGLAGFSTLKTGSGPTLPPINTGLAGRPTPLAILLQMMRDRAAAGQMLGGVGAEARALVELYSSNPLYASYPRITPGSLENAMRDEYRRLKTAPK